MQLPSVAPGLNLLDDAVLRGGVEHSVDDVKAAHAVLLALGQGEEDAGLGAQAPQHLAGAHAQAEDGAVAAAGEDAAA